MPLPVMEGSGKRALKRPAAAARQRDPQLGGEGALEEQEGHVEEAEEPRAAQEEPQEPKHCELCPPIPLTGPPLEASTVQDLINKSLEDEGKTFRIKAYLQKRKRNPAFELKCATCTYKSCTWKGFALSDTACQSLTSYELTNRNHGDPKPDAPARGRKSRGSRPALSVTERVAYDGNMTQEAFMSAVVKNFADKPGKQSLAIVCRARKRTRKGLVCSITCSTHCNHRQKKANCPWTGMATLLTSADEPAICIRTCPPGTHAPDQKQKYGTLTHHQRSNRNHQNHSKAGSKDQPESESASPAWFLCGAVSEATARKGAARKLASEAHL